VTANTGGHLASAVAVIGMSARFPGAANVAEFWHNLHHGVESITRFNDAELREAGVDETLLRDPNYVRAAGVLDGIDRFDAGFFGFRDRDAETMDPQHRIFLECAWEALEDAGYQASADGPLTGIFAGTSISTYLLFNLAHRLETTGADFNLATLIGNDKDYLATMTAYKLDLRGPTVAVQTACSTSLVAVHQACQALIGGECDMALAGGVTVRVPHRVGYLHQGGSMLSPDGHCRAFDERASGTVPGSGAGVVVLKRLSDAADARDCIRAVILGSAINNDGAVKAGFTAPTVDGQASVIAAAHSAAGIDSTSLGYLEAHGTGTRLGDPIEIEALTRAFAPGARRQYCAIGSVKSNFGHLECAAGIAGLIKTILALEHGQIPPSLHFDRANGQIDFSRGPVYVNVSARKWPGPRPRRAAVSSFGFGGANCHMVLEEAPAPEPVPPNTLRPLHLLTLSARNEAAMEQLTARYLDVLSSTTPESLPDLCYTANVGRKKFECRRAAMGATPREMRESLIAARVSSAAGRPLVAMVFPDDCSQLLQVAQTLCRTHTGFRETLRRCDAWTMAQSDEPLLPLLAEGASGKTGPAALFAVQCALASLWRDWGVQPHFILGHGLGEYAAACVAGVFGLEDGLSLARCRGRERRARGVGVGAGQEAAETVFESQLAGSAHVTFSEARLPVISTRTGCAVPSLAMGEKYWAALDCGGLAREAFQTLARSGCTVFLEIGTGAGLCDVGRAVLPGCDFAWLRSARPGMEWRDLLDSLAALYARGAAIDWGGFDRDYPRRRVPLPTYPFQRKRHWVDAPTRGADLQTTRPQCHPLLGERLHVAGGPLIFETRLSALEPAFLADHRVKGSAVFPLTAYVEMASAAAREAFGNGITATVTDIEVEAPLLLTEGSTRRVQVVVTPGGQGVAAFALYRDADGSTSWHRHGAATLRAGQFEPAASESLSAARDACRAEGDIDEFYTRLRESGMEYGPQFRGVRRLWTRPDHALARVEGDTGGSASSIFYPPLADACLQAVGACLPRLADGLSWLPVSVNRVWLRPPCCAPLWSHARITSCSADSISAAVEVFDDSGRLVAAFEGIRMRHGRAAPASAGLALHHYQVAWSPCPPLRGTRQLTGTWMVFDEGEGLGHSVACQMRAAGAHCVVVRHGVCFERETPSGYRIRDSNRADFDSLFAETSGRLTGVVYLWSLGVDRHAGSALLLSQALVDAPRCGGFRLWLVTRSAQQARPEDRLIAPEQALMWGLGRVLANEHPELGSVLLDIDPGPSDAIASMLAADCALEHPEEECAYRGGSRFVPRLERRAGERRFPDGPYRLPLPPDKLLANLSCVAADVPALGPGEVGIRVRATGLNFRDVLNAMGMYPDVTPLGTDCAGEIYAVGPGVSGFAVGQPVVAVASGSFASHVSAAADFVSLLPAGISFEHAASLPTVLLTAHHALFRVGELKRGQAVLIHAGTGGVGLAAVRMALAAGAVVFATAGSREKREYLTSLGVSHAMDSRSLDFAHQVLDSTGGQGVDLVLNSLGGESIPASLSTVRGGGRFLEIGKIGVWDDARVAEAYPDLSYHRIALDELMRTSRGELSLELRDVLERHWTAAERSPLPVRLFPITGVADAFRHMQGARHIGKVVVRHPREIRPDATYLVVGGLGALGQEMAAALSNRGAGALVLVGRTPPSARARAAVESLQSRGVRVECRQADISRSEDVARLFSSLSSERPLRGIVHAAGQLDDCSCLHLTGDRFEAAVRSKVAGAWNLHRASLDLPLDFFVLYSSAAALLGPPGQAAYAAANCFLDALSHYRQSLGLPCLTVNWGPWSIGMSAATDAARPLRWSDLGLGRIEPAPAHDFLDHLLRTGTTQAAVIPADWPSFVGRFAGGRLPALLRDLGVRPKTVEAACPRFDWRRDLDELPAEARPAALRSHVRDLALQILGRTGQMLDDHVSLLEFGFDSLMTVELRNALGSLTGARLPSTLVFDYPTIQQLSVYLAEAVFHWTPRPLWPEPVPVPVSQPPRSDGDVKLEDLAEDQLAEWILQTTDNWREYLDRTQ
jgi:acyl transferase domain-containing protein/NADPH:quinone reductase-like Zn-dependent oxidoreductase/acyl carrier protein